MRQFRCLGPDCEDTCCQSWDVHYDKKHYELLQNRIKNDPQGRALIERSLLVNTAANRTDNNYALVQFGQTRYCPLLDEDDWCLIHRRFGMEVLNDTCTFFPRVFTRYNNTVEMTGALSCPEVVRLCLAADLTTAWVPFKPDLLPRTEVPFARTYTEAEADFYAEEFHAIRQCLLETLCRADYALETKLFVLANFSHRLSQNYHQGAPANLPFITAEVQRLSERGVWDGLEQFYSQYVNDEPIAMIVIQSILQLHIQKMPDDKLSRIARPMLAITHTKDKPVATLADEIYADNQPPQQLWETFQKNWLPLNAAWGVELELYLTRYALNCLQREWFVAVPTPFIAIHLLCIRLAVLRFLITGYPPLREFVQQHRQCTSAEHVQLTPQFRAFIVELMYTFARGFDQNLPMLQVIYAALNEQQMMSFDYSLPLIKF